MKDLVRKWTASSRPLNLSVDAKFDPSSILTAKLSTTSVVTSSRRRFGSIRPRRGRQAGWQFLMSFAW